MKAFNANKAGLFEGSFVWRQGNVKKSCKKVMKLVNNDEENIHIFRIFVTKSHKKTQGFTLSLENTVLENHGVG